ncbi:hypothetical protein [Aquimarina sp. MMG016]|uniref:hypothetical protein n=1 Tax=Aquimarina sp. MMG016 TaxID=2822690 RepID=UPI001B39D426|nr:hypothetical protein [Aquimarina sp. MMG016]MBQ4819674.1 hypothetical protein [Aquimarina sp. MMG016]
MNRTVKIILVFLSVIILLTVVATWYKYEFSMGVVEAYQVNAPNLDRKLLIATQGSEFKDVITEGIVNHYRSDSIFIKVIDVSSLNDVNPDDYTSIVIMHTWENWKPPVVVKKFIEETLDYHNRMVVLTTSGQGSYSIKQIDIMYDMESIDALAGESDLTKTTSFIKQIVDKLNPMLESE